MGSVPCCHSPPEYLEVKNIEHLKLSSSESAQATPEANTEETVAACNITVDFEAARKETSKETGHDHGIADMAYSAEERSIEAQDADTAKSITLNLTSGESTALREIRLQLGVLGTRLQEHLVPGELEDSCLLRFLKERNLNAASAAKAVLEDIEWRKKVVPSALADKVASQILGCEAEVVRKYVNTWHQGFDRLGRPLIFAHYGNTRLRPLLEHTSIEHVIKLHIHNAEKTARLCGQQTLKLGRDISESMVVVDAEGWDSRNLITKEAYTWVKGWSEIDRDHYPARLGLMLIINAPSVVYYFWKAIQVLVPGDVRSKIRIRSGRDTWRSELLELVDARELPAEYEGSGVYKGQ